MIDGLYSGAAALQMLSQQQDIISHNLAHANTSGHRRLQAAVQQRFVAEDYDVSIDLGPQIDRVEADFQPGRNVATGRPLDVSINGDGFFVFGNGDQEYFSRNGRLFRDPETNLLINEEGFPIQGESGTITIDENISDRDITIGRDGTITAAGESLGRLRTVVFEDNYALRQVGASKFFRTDQTVESDQTAQLSQFQHELSNVQPVIELVSLIVNNRQYEAIQRATRTLSDSLRDYIRG